MCKKMANWKRIIKYLAYLALFLALFLESVAVFFDLRDHCYGEALCRLVRFAHEQCRLRAFHIVRHSHTSTNHGWLAGARSTLRYLFKCVGGLFKKNIDMKVTAIIKFKYFCLVSNTDIDKVPLSIKPWCMWCRGLWTMRPRLLFVSRYRRVRDTRRG